MKASPVFILDGGMVQIAFSRSTSRHPERLVGAGGGQDEELQRQGRHVVGHPQALHEAGHVRATPSKRESLVDVGTAIFHMHPCREKDALTAALAASFDDAQPA
jgi:hypothetical protein